MVPKQSWGNPLAARMRSSAPTHVGPAPTALVLWLSGMELIKLTRRHSSGCHEELIHSEAASPATALLQYLRLVPDFFRVDLDATERDLLLRIYYAEQRWADSGHDDRAFLLMHRGACSAN